MFKSQSELLRLALFMWSLDYYKIAYFQYGFCKESSKINTFHMVPTKKFLFFNILSIYGCEKWLIFVVSSLAGFDLIHFKSVTQFYTNLFKIIVNFYCALIPSFFINAKSIIINLFYLGITYFKILF